MYENSSELNINPVMEKMMKMDLAKYFDPKYMSNVVFDGTRPFIMIQDTRLLPVRNGNMTWTISYSEVIDYRKNFYGQTKLFESIYTNKQFKNSTVPVAVIYTDNKPGEPTIITSHASPADRCYSHQVDVFYTDNLQDTDVDNLIDMITKYVPSNTNTNAWSMNDWVDSLVRSSKSQFVRAIYNIADKKHYIQELQMYIERGSYNWVASNDHPVFIKLTSQGKISEAIFCDMPYKTMKTERWYLDKGSYTQGPSFIKFNSITGKVSKMRYFIGNIDLEKSDKVGSPVKMVEFIADHGQISQHIMDRFFGAVVSERPLVHIENITLSDKTHFNRKINKTHNYVLTSSNEDDTKMITYLQTEKKTNLVSSNTSPAVTVIDAFTGVVTSMFIVDGVPGIEQADGSILYYIEIGANGSTNFYTPHPRLVDYCPEYKPEDKEE